MPTFEITRQGLQCPTKYHKTMAPVSPKFVGLSYKGSTITLHLSEELTTEEQAAFLAADSTFQDVDQAMYVLNMHLKPAVCFGLSMIEDFSTENILLGITQAGMTNHVRKSASEIVDALHTGALYDAILEARAVPAEVKDPIFLSDARLLRLINQIEQFLGVPISPSL